MSMHNVVLEVCGAAALLVHLVALAACTRAVSVGGKHQMDSTLGLRHDELCSVRCAQRGGEVTRS